jgi:hypothetical protein
MPPWLPCRVPIAVICEIEVLERSHTDFTNDVWNAEPGAPMPKVCMDGETLVLTFYLNPWAFPTFKPRDRGELRFSKCGRYSWKEQTIRGGGAASADSVGARPIGASSTKSRAIFASTDCRKRTGLLMAEPRSTNTRHFLFYFKDDNVRV